MTGAIPMIILVSLGCIQYSVSENTETREQIADDVEAFYRPMRQARVVYKSRQRRRTNDKGWSSVESELTWCDGGFHIRNCIDGRCVETLDRQGEQLKLRGGEGSPRIHSRSSPMAQGSLLVTPVSGVIPDHGPVSYTHLTLPTKA